MVRFLFRCLLLALAFAPGFAQTPRAAAPAGLPTGDAWLQHFNRDLIVYWTGPGALGTEPGAFPSTRCDDGSALNYSNPCPEIANNPYLMTPARYLVALSRQTYGYGVAYHLTGNPQYLQWARQGVDYIRRNAIDPAGGMYTRLDLTSNTWGPARQLRNPQELAYGLLGLGFYYYLTRDEAVLPDILAVRKYIFDNYYNPQLGALQWMLANNGGTLATERRLVADLDQMNAYMALLIPVLPEPHQTEWKQALRKLAHSLLSVYYSPRENLFFLTANRPQDRDLAVTGTDFGHSIKSMWMLRWTGLLTGDLALEHFGAKYGARILERAYLAEDGSWAQSLQAGGALDKNKSWWIYAELDQFSASLGLVDRSTARFLPSTNEYWFRYFVDPLRGEVWNGVNYGTNLPQRDMPRVWPWKNAYHSFEHALVGYITSQWMYGQPARLHYAFQSAPQRSTVRPYFFDAPVLSYEETAANHQTVTFAAPAEPVPAAAVVTSGASFLPAPVSAGSIASVFGPSLATGTAHATLRPLPYQLGGTRVTLRDSSGADFQVGLFYCSRQQLNLLNPSGVRTGPATLTIRLGDDSSVTARTTIVPLAPALFQANPAISLIAANAQRVKADLSQSLEPLAGGVPIVPIPLDLGPATDRVYLTLYTTGLKAASQVTAFVGGLEVPVTYFGSHQDYDGLEQVNIGPLPRSLAGAGATNLLLSADNQTAPPVELVIR